MSKLLWSVVIAVVAIVVVLSICTFVLFKKGILDKDPAGAWQSIKLNVRKFRVWRQDKKVSKAVVAVETA